jgi:hypothetical protein
LRVELVAWRLWLAACAFCASIAPRSSVSRFLSCANSALRPSMICRARASFAFLSCSTWAFTFWTSGWPSLNFSESRPCSTARPASCVLKPITTASAATCGSASSSWPSACISRACLSAASIVMRRACAWTKSSLSLVIEVETAETLPSGTNRSCVL